MAGDWIKIEHALPDKPEVSRISDILGITEDEVVGKLVRLWVWADQHTADGHAVSVTQTTLDRRAGCPGLAEALRKVGWLEGRDAALEFPRFDRHNGQSAKKRGQALDRKKAERGRNPSRGSHADGVTKTGPEPEPEQSLASSTKNTGDPCTSEEAWNFAQSAGVGVTKEGVELWHAKKSDAGWVMHRQNGVIQPIENWQANLRGSVAWIREDLAKAQAAELRTKPFGAKPIKAGFDVQRGKC